MRVRAVEHVAARAARLPVLATRVPAGFPSPADDYLDEELDLAAYLIERPASTFMMTVDGPSMEGAGIFSGDKIVVDKATQPLDGAIVVAVVHGDMTVKRLKRTRGGHVLIAEPRESNQDHYPVFEIDEGFPVEIWGVVVGVVRRLPR